jgi:hypothetical protein
MPKFHDVEQNTPEWKALRLGIITASNMDSIISPTGVESKSVDKYINKLIAEQITGESADTFEGNPHTARGHEYQQEAADYFAMLHGVELKQVGFVTTDDGLLGCSPDYLIGDDAFLEVKTGLPHIMVENYLSGKLEQSHRPQTQATAYILQRNRCFTMLYNPLIKPIIIESKRNDQFIMDMIRYVANAMQMMQKKKAILAEQGFFAEDGGKYLRAG